MKRTLAALALALGLAVAGCGGASHPATRAQSATGSVHPAGWGLPAAPASTRLAGPVLATATMFDSIDTATVPASPFAQAGYTAGFWPTYLPMRQRWPLSHTVSIAISARYRADCLDVEPGDATPGQAAAWVRADLAAGFAKPCVYSSFWEYVNQVRPALAAAGIARDQVFEWDADYTYVAHIDASFDATQYTDKCLGRNLDCSLVTLAFLSIAQPPYITPPPPLPPPLRAICFGQRYNHAPVCNTIRPLTARRSRARDATRRALAHANQDLAAHHCRRPYRRTVCRRDGHRTTVLARRQQWFAAKVRQALKQYGG